MEEGLASRGKQPTGGNWEESRKVIESNPISGLEVLVGVLTENR